MVITELALEDGDQTLARKGVFFWLSWVVERVLRPYFFGQGIIELKNPAQTRSFVPLFVDDEWQRG